MAKTTKKTDIYFALERSGHHALTNYMVKKKEVTGKPEIKFSFQKIFTG